jgi:hypothetical protein
MLLNFKNRKNILVGFALSAVFFLFNLSGVVYAQRNLLNEANGMLGNTVAETGIPQDDVTTRLGDVIKVALTAVGSVFFLLMIYAGFLWMTARGDEGQIDKSKQIISGTIIGLVLVVSAYAITVFVTGRFETSGPTSDATSGAVGCCVSCTRGGASSECTRVWGVTRSACENLDTQTPSGSCDGTLTCTLDTGILQTDCH